MKPKAMSDYFSFSAAHFSTSVAVLVLSSSVSLISPYIGRRKRGGGGGAGGASPPTNKFGVGETYRLPPPQLSATYPHMYHFNICTFYFI